MRHTPETNLFPIVTVESSLNPKIQVDLDSHTDTSVVGSKVLVVHDHECYIDVFGYNRKSRHKNVTTVDSAVAYDDPQTADTSVLLINQAILIPSIFYIVLSYAMLS